MVLTTTPPSVSGVTVMFGSSRRQNEALVPTFQSMHFKPGSLRFADEFAAHAEGSVGLMFL